MPPVWHPLVRRHPVSGKKSLFISPIYNDRIEGMADEAAVELVAELTAFAERLETEEMRQATIEDFQLARSLGVTGFPTVVVKDDQGYAYLTVGYQPYEQLGSLLDAWLDGRVERRAAEG